MVMGRGIHFELIKNSSKASKFSIIELLLAFYLFFCQRFVRRSPIEILLYLVVFFGRKGNRAMRDEEITLSEFFCRCTNKFEDTGTGFENGC